MDHPQRLGQDGNMRWRTRLYRDEAASQSPAWSRPPASKSAKSGLPVRRRSVYPLNNARPTAAPASLPVHEEATSNESVYPEDAKPRRYIQSSMGRPGVQKSGKHTGRTSLEPHLGSTTGGYLDSGDSGLRKDDTTRIDSIPKTLSPLSIRYHIARLEASEKDKNGPRTNHAKGLQLHPFFGVNNRHTIRLQSNQRVPTVTKGSMSLGNASRHANSASYIRHQKSKSLHGERTTVQEYDKNLGHGCGSFIRCSDPNSAASRPSKHESQILPAAPRLCVSWDGNSSFDKRNLALLPGMKRPASNADLNTAESIFESKRPYSNSIKDDSFLNSEASEPFQANDVMNLRQSGKNVVTTSTSAEGYVPLPHAGDARTTTPRSYYPSDQGLIGRKASYMANSNTSFVPGGMGVQITRPSEIAPMVRYRTQSPGLPMHLATGPQPGRRYDPPSSNRSPNNGLTTDDGTSNINYTISKDSCADEKDRNAKLLAEMGERNQRNPGGNDVVNNGIPQPHAARKSGRRSGIS